MPLTLQELENVANAAIDFHWRRGEVLSQTIQDKPLLRHMMENQRSFPGGKELITVRVKGEYTTRIQGFEYDDTVEYRNPANIRTASYTWKLIHWGITFTMHELLHSGINITETTHGRSTSTASQRELVMLADLLRDKLEDMDEGSSRDLNDMFWGDGTADAKLVPGIRSFILDDPTAATVVGGIDQASNDWWRNRATLNISLGSTPDEQKLVQFLQNEWRQLRRFGGRPNLVLCGSDFMDQFEKELRAKGNYTETGWAQRGRIDASVADVSFKGVPFNYDPTLDDMGQTKRAYVMDTRFIHPMHIDGEDRKRHFPARPEDKYAFYRAVTWVGGLVCRKRNCHGVYAFS